MSSFRPLINKLFGSGSSMAAPVRPPGVSWILEHRAELQKAATTQGDTPLAALYRLYEYFVAGYSTGLRSEVEFFFNHPTWAVADIPDPQDPDPERYAILAVLPYYLAHAFNRLIKRGLPRGCPAIITSAAEEDELRSRPVVLEQEPEWVRMVPKLEKGLVIPCKDGSEPKKPGSHILRHDAYAIPQPATCNDRTLISFLQGVKIQPLSPITLMDVTKHMKPRPNPPQLLEQGRAAETEDVEMGPWWAVRDEYVDIVWYHPPPGLLRLWPRILECPVPVAWRARAAVDAQPAAVRAGDVGGGILQVDHVTPVQLPALRCRFGTSPGGGGVEGRIQ
ncbi:hypothetical protein VMCG_07997 [Cytospora schulzeri]|uniref:Uncharacterized protein n=1 Tax=Cytospora schulzeri TaxID=448051 RepID=A0A423VYA4_9PEZI|nr:hypothetical protein VMCG_07997 [Valsa malicola]